MAFRTNNYVKTIFIFMIFFVFGFQEVLAMRPLEGEQWLNKGLAIQSLQRGPVTPSGSNPCTYIPGGGRGRCTLAENEMNFAGGHIAHAPPAVPDVMVKFTVASNANDSQKQDKSS